MASAEHLVPMQHTGDTRLERGLKAPHIGIEGVIRQEDDNIAVAAEVVYVEAPSSAGTRHAYQVVQVPFRCKSVMSPSVDWFLPKRIVLGFIPLHLVILGPRKK